MKKTGILNHQLAGTIAAMGHTDLLVIADAGLPVPPGVPCIDLAVRPGLPSFLDVVRAIAVELQIEGLTFADELLARNETVPAALEKLFPGITPHHVPHDEFKQLTERAKAIVRTGECTPYNNVILTGGVTF